MAIDKLSLYVPLVDIFLVNAYITLDVAKVSMQDPVSEVNLYKGIAVIVGLQI